MLIYYLWLMHLPGIGIHTARRLLQEFHTPQAIYEASLWELLQVRDIGRKKAEIISESKDLRSIDQLLKKCRQLGIQIMTIDDPCYPMLAKEISDMPLYLFYMGTPRTNMKPCAIIGSRHCSRAGRDLALKTTNEMMGKHLTIMSTLSRGVDGYVQTACLNGGGSPIGVMPCGLDICYPREHDLLIQRMKEQGLLLSAYEPGVKPSKRHFPAHSRLLAACAKHMVLVEPESDNAPVIAAGYARMYERPVYDARLRTLSPLNFDL